MTDQQHAINAVGQPSRPVPLRNGRAEWLHRWLEGETPDAASLEQYGFQAQQYYAVVLYRPAICHDHALAQATNSVQLATLLQAEANRRGINGPVFAYDDRTTALFHPVEDPQQTTRLKRKTEEIRKQLSIRLNNVDVHCGVGRPASGMDGLRQSFREAEQALRVSDELQIQARATFFGNSSLFMLLRSLKSPEELERFCMTWLTDLITYDARQHSDLLETLRAYFANNGNTALTAKELRIHRNTLAYRLNRIAQITRLDLEDADVRLNLHLALKAYEVLTAPSSVSL
ncbi:MAG: helix-turn-helix domain-containing protein [Anaerolineae bacterium]|nr:helix-turn-helix domain-containing protein [Anaerolineae bacterium]